MRILSAGKIDGSLHGQPLTESMFVQAELESEAERYSM